MLGFKYWIIKEDLFGFDDETLHKRIVQKMRRPDEKPIHHFAVNNMMDRLADNKVGDHQGFQKFVGECQWGNRAGAIKVELGMQYTVYIERLLHDLEGSPVWVTKKIFKINVDEFNRYEDAVADAIFEEVLKIYKEGLDGPVRKYESLSDLVEEVVDKAKVYGGDYFFYERTKKVNDHNYIVVFGALGGGTGILQAARSEGRINQYIIDISFSPKTGLLHVIETTVQSGDEGTSWALQPAFFEGWYAPTQDTNQIVESIVVSMKYF
jgi:hypothetical protein